jgi:hypothetical protein
MAFSNGACLAALTDLAERVENSLWAVTDLKNSNAWTSFPPILIWSSDRYNGRIASLTKLINQLLHITKRNGMTGEHHVEGGCRHGFASSNEAERTRDFIAVVLEQQLARAQQYFIVRDAQHPARHKGLAS